MKEFFVYIIECSNNSLYTGYTTNVNRRYQEHISGSYKCKYTRSFPPKKLAAYWRVGNTLSEALKAENKIKKLTREQKQILIKNPNSFHDFI